MQITGIIVNVSQELTKNNKPYCKVNLLTPQKAQINVWGCKAISFKSGNVFTAEVKVDDLGMSCSYADITFTEPTEEQLAWIPKPPSKSQWSLVVTKLSNYMEEFGCYDKEVKFFQNQAKKLYEPFCIYPAGKSNHHAYSGGLARHTYEILDMYASIYSSLPYKTNPFIVAISALFHDAAKILCYVPITFDYTSYGSLVNHVAGSAEMLSALMRKEEFPERTIVFATHCVLAHHEFLEYGSPVKPACVEALTLAMLDRLSGHGTQMKENASLGGTKVQNLGQTIFEY